MEAGDAMLGVGWVIPVAGANVGKILARGVMVCLAAVMLAACTHISTVAGPAPAFDIDKDIADLQTQYEYSRSIPDYYKKVATAPDEAARRNLRDEFVVGRLTLYNLQYLKYISQFSLDAATVDSALDITKIGVDLATTVTGTAETKSILGAISTGLTGSRLSLEKNFFEQKTVQALVSQMNAQRKAALVPIVEGLAQDTNKYPITTAIVDLYNYYGAGTLQGALQGIQEDASAKGSKAQFDIDKFRSVIYGADAATKAINAWIYPGYKSFDADGNALDAAGKTVPANEANTKILKQWVRQKYGKLPVEIFLSSGDFAADRKDAMGALHIPN